MLCGGPRMKFFPVIATLVVGGFATLGFAAGSLTLGHDRAAPLRAEQQNDLLPKISAQELGHDTQAETILRMAEARTTAPSSTPVGAMPASAAQSAPKPVANAHLVKMANVTLPVRKSASVSFVVADLAVAVRDADSAARYEIPQNAARLQAAIEDAMIRASATPIMRGVTIDSASLSNKLTSVLQESFTDVEDVLFLTLYKHDVGYN